MCRSAFAPAHAMIYAYILCNFQCTIQCLSIESKITEDNLLIQDSINNWMISNCYWFHCPRPGIENFFMTLRLFSYIPRKEVIQPHLPPVYHRQSRQRGYIQYTECTNWQRGLRALRDLPQHLTTRADDNHAPPVTSDRRKVRLRTGQKDVKPW